MGRPIRLVAPTLINALTSAAIVSASGASATVSTGSIPLPVELGGGASTQAKVTAGAANTNMFTFFTTTFNFAQKKGVEFWVYVDGLADASNRSVGGTGTVVLRSSGATATLTAVISFHQGWNHIRLGRADFTAVVGGATFDGTTFVDVTVKWDGLAGVTPTLYFLNLSYAGYSRPQIALVFDDGYNTVYDTAKPIMDLYGIPGTVGVISSLVGSSGKMDLTRLNNLHAAGWAMANHTNTHGASPWLESASQATCYGEINTCKTYLEAQGWTRDGENLDFIAPYGEWSDNYRAAWAQAGCRSFWGLGNSDYTSAPSKPSFSDRGVQEPYLNRLSAISGITGAQFEAVIERCINSGRSCVVLVHSVVPSPSVAIEVSTAAFTHLCAYLHRRRALVDFVTLPQLFLRLVDPTV